MKNILITGALGHIGSKFISKIKKNEFNKIIIIDNLYTQRYCSLFNLNKNINLKFIEKDILDVSIEKYFTDIDIVRHSLVRKIARAYEKKSTKRKSFEK